MKKKKLETQYNSSAKNYDDLHIGENKKSTSQFFETVLNHVKPYKNKKKLHTLLDLGCGAGSDFDFYSNHGFWCCGVDSSSKMLSLVKNNFPEVRVHQADFSKAGSIPFRGYSDLGFKIVTSKWAFQTARNIQGIYENVHRILIPKGYFIFLVVHPFRQFLEKKKSGKDYFKKEIVASEIFNKKITVYEPTHTMQEYLSSYFLKHFEVLEIKEDYEFPAAEQIGGDIYPTHLIVVARKK